MMSKSYYLQAVEAFHQAFGAPIAETPEISPQWVHQRLELIREEVAEWEEAVQAGDYLETAKELADVLYVVFGAAVTFGIPIDDVFAEVHRSNMSKLWNLEDAVAALEAGEVAHVELFREYDLLRQSEVVRAVCYREDGKVLKPPTYSPADLSFLGQ